MKRHITFGLLAFGMALGMSSCMKEPERKAVGPVSENSKIPWNRPIAGQGQGQLGMMPQSQYRR